MVSKLLHIFNQHIMLLKWPSRISRVLLTLQLRFYLLAFTCRGRIKKLEKACMDLAAQ